MENKGYAHRLMNRPDEEIKVCDKVIRRFGESTEPSILAEVARAMANKGYAHRLMKQPDEEIDVCDEVIRRFGDATEPSILAQVARAMVNKGLVLCQMKRPNDGIEVCDEMIRRFGDATEPPIREEVARAMVTKGLALRQMKRPNDGIEVCDGVIRHFGDATEPSVLAQVARAKLGKALSYDQMNQHDKAIRVCDELTSCFHHVSEPLLVEVVAAASLVHVQCLIEKGDHQKARELFDSVRDTHLSIEAIRSMLKHIEEYAPIELLHIYTIEDLLREVLYSFGPETVKPYFDTIKNENEKTDRFIYEDSKFISGFSFLLVLREWNSYTPVIPREGECDRGGGYFIRHAGEGIVIDPGYKFIENFGRAGGHVCDIDHIIVTHAHDDHTAELEALHMLLHRRWKRKDKKKQVSLYLSAGVQRKYSGLFDLRDPKYRRIETLCPTEKDLAQKIRVNDKTLLTVLPANHDDVVTYCSAVGLAFELTLDDGKIKKIVFTSDTGLYPASFNKDGKIDYEKECPDTPKLNRSKGKALFEQYPEKFKTPDLLVSHLGSIKETEFPESSSSAANKEEHKFYPNHLGLLGTAVMLYMLNPRAAIIGEIGVELRDIYFELVSKLRKVLHVYHQRLVSNTQEPFIIPSDLTIAYDIKNHQFLSHETCTFMDPKDLFCYQSNDYNMPAYKKSGRHAGVEMIRDAKRTYLFPKSSRKSSDKDKDDWAKAFFKKLFNHELPYHKVKSASPGE
jgi:hypothetical protein